MIFIYKLMSAYFLFTPPIKWLYSTTRSFTASLSSKLKQVNWSRGNYNNKHAYCQVFLRE